jgi:hypothetical protein
MSINGRKLIASAKTSSRGGQLRELVPGLNWNCVAVHCCAVYHPSNHRAIVSEAQSFQQTGGGGGYSAFCLIKLCTILVVFDLLCEE